MSWLISKALLTAFENSPCSPGRAVASSGASSSAGEPSALLNVMPTPHPFWRKDRMMESWSPSQYGLTCAPLTADRGEALLTWFRAGFHAPTYPLPETKPGLTETKAACGSTWPESLARLDRPSHSWKTRQHLLFSEECESLPTLPRWGMTVGGELWALTMPALRTNESVSGFAHNFPTPCSGMHGLDGGSNSRKTAKERGTWPTPTKNGWRAEGSILQLWKLVNSGKIAEAEAEAEAMAGGSLRPKRIFPTPTLCGNYNRKGASPTSGDGLATVVGGALNPEWVEWLMGWPIGWTALDALETVRFQEWLNSHGKPCGEAQGKKPA